VRKWSAERIHTAVYTHGHADHAYGMPPFLAEAAEKRWPATEIVAHEAVRPRMLRYIETAGYNSIINSRQFAAPVEWPTDPVFPTVEYATRTDLDVGGRRLELHHARGETDDHTWVYLPDARVLYTGDLFIWASPNAGNPQKVQRFAWEWAQALRKMAALSPEVLLPGHGLPVFGAERVRTALVDTADYLEHIHRAALAGLNAGATVYDIIAALEIPARLRDRPYLQPVYDEPEFVVRNVVRCYGGWYSGVPSELKPAHPREQAREIVRLAGGVAPLLERARALLAAGDLRMAAHLVDWAAEVAPTSSEVHELRATVYEARVAVEPSTMSKGIFGDAARNSRQKLAT
jgi:alkyl sulfatase BDS1-like metallo-beta-lactamase superfamily hydrolase